MKDAKILERVRRLLAMAADTSSPNEAAIAAGRARHLMDKWQISEMELRTSHPDDFGSAVHPVKEETYVGVLAIAMAWLNDCNVQVVIGKRGFTNYQFDGYLVDTVTARELFLYLLAQCEVQAKRVMGAKKPFRSGFAFGVQTQVRAILKQREQLVMSDGRSLVVSKKAMVTERFGVMRTHRPQVNNQGSTNYQKGFDAGKAAGLNRQVGGETQRKLG